MISLPIKLPFLAQRFRGEHAYVVAYDVANPKRWRRVFKLMHGYGEWLQLSVFQCRLTEVRRQSMEASLTRLIEPRADHVLIVDLGPAETAGDRITTLGRVVALIERRATVI
ncbi:MAG: CRISPR-associated endonuclease Cas2 [Azospirillum sp.]|nr:CRISPR-associated endonuclease Cas2 [Azospirillum sp.]